MTAANPDAAPEFYGPARTADLGDPALDPPMTVRVRGAEDRASRYAADAWRAVRTTRLGTRAWLLVAGPSDEEWLIGGWLHDDEVRTWPVVHSTVNSAAFRLAAGHQAGHGEQVHERGDLDVDAFRGGET